MDSIKQVSCFLSDLPLCGEMSCILFNHEEVMVYDY